MVDGVYDPQKHESYIDLLDNISFPLWDCDFISAYIFWPQGQLLLLARYLGKAFKRYHFYLNLGSFIGMSIQNQGKKKMMLQK